MTALTAAEQAVSRCWSESVEPPRARTASQAAAVANALFTSSIAALCCNAWNVPIGLPNCSRVRRCSVTASTHHWVIPAATDAVNATVSPVTRPASNPVSTAAAGTV